MELEFVSRSWDVTMTSRWFHWQPGSLTQLERHWLATWAQCLQLSSGGPHKCAIIAIRCWMLPLNLCINQINQNVFTQLTKMYSPNYLNFGAKYMATVLHQNVCSCTTCSRNGQAEPGKCHPHWWLANWLICQLLRWSSLPICRVGGEGPTSALGPKKSTDLSKWSKKWSIPITF